MLWGRQHQAYVWDADAAGERLHVGRLLVGSTGMLLGSRRQHRDAAG